MSRSLAVALALALLAASLAHAATLTGETSRPTYSVFLRGEPVQLRFTAAGLPLGQAGLKLLVVVSDGSEQELLRDELPVTADGQGAWTGTMAACSDRLGYFHVTARLSTGETLPAVGSRPAGYLTYLVVTDPANRARPGEGARFGLQGGFSTAFDVRPLLGVNWVLGGHSWGNCEPDHAGQFAESRVKPDPERAARLLRDKELGVVPLFCILGGIPKWAQATKDGKPVKGVIGDLKAFADFCRESGRAAAADYPHLKQHVFQVTWEPVYPWGFEGTDEDLIRIYQTAYPALHEADPKAVVIGPTGAGISGSDVAWNERLLKAGIGKYLDGFAIHPYLAQPPEEHNLAGNIRALEEIIRTNLGRDLDLYGTEQGFPTGATQAQEMPQALWLTRSYLITFGEGFKMNTAFYACDYPGEPGYGFFHNLVQDKQPWAPGFVSPKPVAGAFAAMTMLLEGHRSLGPVEGLGSTSVGYAFECDGRVTLALWDYGQQPHPITLTAGTPNVELIDWMGNAQSVVTSNGTLALELGPRPQYVRGVAPELWGSKAKKPLVLAATSLSAFPGEALKLALTLTPPAGIKGAGNLSATLGEGLAATRQAVTLSAGKPTVATLSLTVPVSAATGLYPLQIGVETGGKTWGLTRAMVRVREAVDIEGVLPLGGGRLQVKLRNLRATPTAGEVSARVQGVPGGSATLPLQLPAKQSVALTFAFPQAQLDAGRNYPLTITIAEKAALLRESAYTVAFTDFARPPAALKIDGDLGEWSSRPAVLAQGREWLVRQPQLYRGRDDLSAKVRAAWDKQALYLAVDVTDDAYLQPEIGFNTWKGDCLQVGVDTQPSAPKELTGNLLADTGNLSNVEIDLALTAQGPQAYRTISPDPTRLPVRLLTADEAQLAVVRTPTGLRYEAALPWKSLGRSAAPPPGHRLGFALTVNDFDEPNQLDPKALGVFGGITPGKDPQQFGRVVLVDEPAPVASPVGSTLTLDGILGQSQPPAQEPLDWTVCAGVGNGDAGDLWAISQDRACRFRAGALLEAIKLPTGMRLARGDAGRIVCLSHEGDFYAFDLARKQATLLCKPDFADRKPPREFALGPQGDLYALGQDNTVRKWDRSGQPLGEILRLQPGKDWDYRALGVDPVTGDLWLGTYYPDMKLKRYVAGKPEPVEVREGFATFIAPIGKSLWWVGVGGAAQSLRSEPGAPQPPQSDFTYYPTGVVAAADGGTWVSCAQGAIHFNAQGCSTGQRLGGLTGSGLVAAGAQGTVLTLLESGRRFVRMSAADAPDAPFRSNSNEPWRVANGWSGVALGLAWMGDAYLVLDQTTKALWRFDPDHVAWAEKPWVKLTEENALPAPRALAVGDSQAFVLDGDRLLAFPLADLKAKPTAIPLPSGAAVTALAADGDRRFIAADGQQVTASDEKGTVLWQVALKAQSLAAQDGLLIATVDQPGAVGLLDTATGKTLATLNEADVPGGLAPRGVALRLPWAFVTDAKGQRLLRLRVR